MKLIIHGRFFVLFSSLFFSLSTFFSVTANAGTHHSGATLGNFGVSNTGAANYSIKLSVPPGTSGLVPALSLGYSSQSGNGHLGMGWSLGGLSTIHRCPQTLAQDNNITRVSYTWTDRFCLDGSRLIAVKGKYGVEGTEYRTETASYSKIISYGIVGNGPLKFKVWTKAGQVLEYGYTADSRIEAQNKPTARLWAVNKISDTVGNYLTIKYFENNINGTYRVSRIDYTGNTVAGTQPNASVQFFYQLRTDRVISYTAGSMSSMTKRLQFIRTYVGPALVKEYRLKYDYGLETGRSRLLQLRECGASGNCKLSSRFSWQKTTVRQFKRSSTFELSDFAFSGIEGGKRKGGAQKSIGTRLADINGDGILDLIQLDSYVPWYGNATKRRVSLGTGTTFVDHAGYTNSLPPNMLFSTSGIDQGTRLIDINGDGLPDLIQLYFQNAGQGGRYVKRVYLNTGSGFQKHVGYSNSKMTSAFARNGVDYGTRMADLNGDGLVDIVELFKTTSGATNKKVYLNNGSAFVYDPVYSATLPGLYFALQVQDRRIGDTSIVTTLQLADVNGDGLPDLVSVISRTPRQRTNAVYINTGKKFIRDSSFSTSLPIVPLNNPLNYTYLSVRNAIKDIVTRPEDINRMVDINGDGLMDLIQVYSERVTTMLPPGVYPDPNDSTFLRYQAELTKKTYNNFTKVYLSTGRKFKFNKRFSDSLLPLNGKRGFKNIRFADINGDGRVDIVQQDSIPWSIVAQRESWTFICKGAKPGARYFDPTSPYKLFYDLPKRAVCPYSKLALLNNGIRFTESKSYTDSMQNINFYQGTRLADINGDGLADLVQLHFGAGRNWVSTTVRRVDLNSGSVPDLMIQVADGLGDKVNVNYKPLTDKTKLFYAKDTTKQFPTINIRPPMYVVKSFSRITGIGGKYSFTYQYRGAKVHVRGRGLLGFRQVSVTDSQTGLVNTTRYHQHWPLTGMARYSEKRLGNKTLIDKTINRYQVLDLPMGRKSVQLQSSDKFTYELDGTRVSNVTTTNSYDSYGNATKIIVNHNDGYIKTSNSTYDNDVTKWHLGRLRRTTVSNTTPKQGTQTRASSFTYGLTSGLLKTETIEPNHATLRLTTTHGYDTFGNKTTKTLTGPSIASRTTTVRYDARGQFPMSTTNVLGHTETYTYDPMFGGKLMQTGPNGLTTRWDYDSLGRLFKETGADGTVTTKTYSLCTVKCDQGFPLNITTQTTGSMPTTVYYDALGREIMTSTKGFANKLIIKRTSYNRFGRIANVSSPHYRGRPQYVTKYEYDVLGRTTKIINPDNSTTSKVYRVLRVITTNNKTQTITKIKNSQGKLIKSIDANGNFNTYTYDPFNNLKTVTDAAGNVTRMSYDIRGRKTSMIDPNMGSWTYSYDTLGQLLTQTDAKGQTVTNSYDILGRIKKRIEPEGSSTWTYDQGNKAIGKLSLVNGPNAYSQSSSYDNLGRPSTSTTKFAGQSFTQTITYDAFSRPLTTSYPTGLKLKNVYNTFGFLSEVQNAAGNKSYWKALEYNARGQILREQYGNGLVSERAYNDTTGRLAGIITGNGLVQKLGYKFDTLGNLMQRHDMIQNKIEVASYDNLNRLTSTTINGANAKQFKYDKIGNITFKTGTGDYLYQKVKNAGPNAVTQVKLGTKVLSYGYDKNGNQISGDGRLLTYTSFNKPKTVSKGSTQNTYRYGPGRDRIIKVSVKAGVTSKTLYLGKGYERVSKTGSSIIENKHYIGAGVSTVLLTQRSNKTSDTRYLHKDHIGSTDTITDETGKVKERTSFDPWGERRKPDWNNATISIDSLTTRGFTGHEMDDEIGLINMNARMYDAKLGRFLQADTYVQYPQTTQGFNRYTYVNNNPLSFTDPSGNFIKKLRRGIKRVVRRYGRAIVGVMMVVGTAGMGTAIAGPGVAGQMVGGFLNGALQADIRLAASGIFSGWAYGTIAHPMSESLVKVGVHGVIGGVASEIGGGEFRVGFASAGFTKLIGYIDSENRLFGESRIRNVSVAAVIGGTGSRLAGGKFANGAVTGAFSRLFNDASGCTSNGYLVEAGICSPGRSAGENAAILYLGIPSFLAGGWWFSTSIAPRLLGTGGVLLCGGSGGELCGGGSGSVPKGGNNLVRVRHYTSSAGARGIKKDGAINPGRGDPAGVHVEIAPFGRSKTATGETGAFGKGRFVEFDVPRSSIQPTKVGPRNTGVIPTNRPLDIRGANPRFRRQ